MIIDIIDAAQDVITCEERGTVSSTEEAKVALRLMLDAYREDLEDIANACQMAINTLGDYSISPGELHQAVTWLRGEIKQLNEP